MRALLFACVILLAAAVPGAERILYLSSNDSSVRWTADVFNGFREHIRGAAREQPEIEVYELGVMRNPELAVQSKDIDYLRELLKRKKFDLIVTAGNPASDLIFAEYPNLGGTPVVFCGYTGFDHGKKVQMPLVTGVERSRNLKETLRLGLRLLPQTRKVAVITDGSADGEALFRELRGEMKSVRIPEVIFLHGAFYGTEEMLQQLRQLPEESFVILDNWRSARPEPFVPPAVLGERIMQASQRPVFSLRDATFADGAVGGVLLEAAAYGAETARIARRVLGGERPADIPVQAGPSRAAVNWKALEHWGISPDLVPNSVTLVNRPVSLRQDLRLEAVGIVLVVLLVVLGGVILSMQRQRSRKRLNGLFAALPIHVGVVDSKGRILFYQAGNTIDSEQRPKRLSDLPLELLREIESPVAEVFRSGEGRTLEYGVFGQHRQLELLRLPYRMFGRDTVMWISADVTKLHDALSSMTRLADRSRLILNSIGDAVIVTDADGNVTQMNPMAEKLTGRRESAVAGMKLEEVFRVVSGAEWPEGESPVTGVLRRGEELRLENHPELLSTDGKYYHISASASPVREPDGGVSGAVLFFRDVTGDYEKRATLDAQNTILRNATEVANIVYFRCDRSGRMSPLGDFGKHWACRDGVPVPPGEWIVPDDLPVFRKALDGVLTGETESMRCFYCAGKADSKRHYEMRVVKSASAGKERDGEFYGIIQDVTELVRQKEQLREAMETAQAANHAKSRFITTISSELRTPLDAVIGFSELLQLDGIPQTEMRRDLQAINLAGRTLLSLVNNVLDLAEMETDKLEIQSNPMNLKELFSEMMMIFRQTAEGRGLKLKLVLPEQTPWVMLDPQRFRQILINLIGGAIKSVREGSVVIAAKFDGYHAGDTSGSLTVRISAAGSGVRKPDDPLHPGRTADDESNLELVLSQRLCSRMGGTLRCSSGEGGCAFVIAFDRIACIADALAAGNVPALSVGGAEKNNRVLLVDDVPMNLKVMSAMFSRLGIPHCCCASAREAIREVGTAIPAAVFTDLWMPDMGGDELAEYLARNPATAQVPVVVVTADQQMDPGMKRHFCETLLKPLTLEALKECLKRLEEKKIPAHTEV
ncbi:MAG: PAS domain-containing protein [Lentisphaeria bacterium]|nr:PAS domain-containing protein [Lentisphaeria bacterium]